jgi:hypothetical protein
MNSIEKAIKFTQNISEFEDLEFGSARQLSEIKSTLENCNIQIKGALAALTQNKTYPADIVLAKAMLVAAIAKAE